MNILRKLGIIKPKSSDPVKVVSVEEIKKEALPEIDGYARIAEFQKTGIPYFLKLIRAGSKKDVANIDIYSFQVIELRDMIAEKYGGDTYLGSLVDADMKSVLIPKTNDPERYIFRVDGPPLKADKPKKEKEAKAETWLTPDKLKEYLIIFVPYVLKYLESRGNAGQSTLAMAKDLMELTAGPSVQDIFSMITGVIGETTKIQSLTNPTPPITAGDGAGALQQSGWLQQVMAGIASGLAPSIPALLEGRGNNKPSAIAEEGGQTFSGTSTTQQRTPRGIGSPAPNTTSKLIEMLNRNEAPAIIAEQIVTVLDGYVRSTDPLYPQFAHYLENMEMAFDTMVKLYPMMDAWPGRADELREIVYAICREVAAGEKAREENELYAGSSQNGSDQDGPQAAGIFDQAPVRFSEPVEPEPQTPLSPTEPSDEDTINRSTESMGRDEDEKPDGQDDGGPGPVHSEEHTGEAGEAE